MENWEDLGGTKTSLSSQGLSSKAGSSHSKEAQAAGGQDLYSSLFQSNPVTLLP